MTKAEIVSQIHLKTGVEKIVAAACVDAFVEAVSASLEAKEHVYMRGFGTFLLKTRKEKLGRNITANTSLVIPEHQIVSFKPSKKLAVRIK